MASSSSHFDEALAYSFVQQESLTVSEHQVQTVKLLCEGKDVFVWFLQGLVSPVAALCDRLQAWQDQRSSFRQKRCCCRLSLAPCVSND